MDQGEELGLLADRVEVRVAPRLGPVGRAHRDRGLERLDGGRGVPGAGGRGGQAVEDVLVARVDLRGLVQDLEGLGELAPVVEVHAVVEEILEALGPGRALAEGPLAEGAVGPGALDEVPLVGVGLDQIVEQGRPPARSPFDPAP